MAPYRKLTVTEQQTRFELGIPDAMLTWGADDFMEATATPSGRRACL
jgi:hypothetical protein